MNEQVETTLRWVGDWPWWIGVPAAAVLAIASFAFYRRDVRSMAWWIRGGLPTARALSIFMVVVMLSGPVLHHRRTIGQLAKLWVFLDGSQSMALTDGNMDAGRKVLILEQLGLLNSEAVKLDIPKANEALAEAESAAERAQGAESLEENAWKEITNDYLAHVKDAQSVLSGVIETERMERLKRELANPAEEITNRPLKQIDDRKNAAKDFSNLAAPARKWQAELRELFENSVSTQMADSGSPLSGALRKFEAMPRWQRLQALLLEGDPHKRVLAKMAETYDVQLLTLDGGDAKSIWQPSARESALPTNLPEPKSDVTDLADGLRKGVTSLADGQRGALIVFSDGQHNEGSSPVEVAKVLGGKGTPIYTVGVGSHLRPKDLAIVKVGGPDSVFHEDRYRGTMVIKDDMPVGPSFTVTIRDGEKVLWEQKLPTENRGLRQVSFDFPVKELAAARQTTSAVAGAEVTGLPVELKASIAPVEGEKELSNNEGVLRFRAVTQQRKILIVDGRPRWETRYLRNMFERDEQWDVNCVIAGSKGTQTGLIRGDKPEQFPAEKAKLDTYDLIFFGEIPVSIWKGDELQWLRDFVEKRGGAMVFIDGARGYYAGYRDTPLAPLFPVSFQGLGIREGITQIGLSERATQVAAFALSPERETNAAVWAKLNPPRWLSGATPLPGAETLLEAEVKGQRVPASVSRIFGAGKVYYAGFDDSWRWRYEAADKWHVRFWNQIANFAAEPPFSVRDKFVSLDAGSITYQPGDTADLRVRLRDGEGRPVSDATVDALLFKDGQKVASIRMNVDESGGGLFRGRTAPLEPGAYEVAIESAAIPESQLKARTSFKVEPRETGELTQLAANEELLRQMAKASNGEYFREENFSQVLAKIAPLSQGRVIETDTVLWQDWSWFMPIVGFLTIEWILRKRAGLL